MAGMWWSNRIVSMQIVHSVYFLPFSRSVSKIKSARNARYDAIIFVDRTINNSICIRFAFSLIKLINFSAGCRSYKNIFNESRTFHCIVDFARENMKSWLLQPFIFYSWLLSFVVGKCAMHQFIVLLNLIWYFFSCSTSTSPDAKNLWILGFRFRKRCVQYHVVMISAASKDHEINT